MRLHVFDHVRHSAVVLHSHVCLHVDVGLMAKGWSEVDALRLAVDHLGHLLGGIGRGRGRSLGRGRGSGRAGSSKGDGCSQQKENGLGDGNHV